VRIRAQNGVLPWCGFAPNGSTFVTAGSDGLLRYWADDQLRDVVGGHEGPIATGAYSPDGAVLATVGFDQNIYFWAESGRTPRLKQFSTLLSDEEAIWCEFSPQQELFAVACPKRIDVWDLGGGGHEAFPIAHGDVVTCRFHPTNRMLGWGTSDGRAELRGIDEADQAFYEAQYDGAIIGLSFSADGQAAAISTREGNVALVSAKGTPQSRKVLAVENRLAWCAFGPNELWLAAAAVDGTIWIWENPWSSSPRVVDCASKISVCSFDHDGTLLAVAARDTAVLLLDVPAAKLHARLTHNRSSVVWCEFASNPRSLAVADTTGMVEFWQEQELAPGEVAHFDDERGTVVSTSLAAVVADVPDGIDLLDVARDVGAVAKLLAARETVPPLSIGLFGDWGSGKSFLIGKIRERVQQLSASARRQSDSAYCAHVRNISFNAWHYADANLWASLVTHIFDELAKPEPEAGVSDEQVAASQVARLEERLADTSALAERLRRARARKQAIEARRSILRWTWMLAGVDDERTLEDVERDVTILTSGARILLPNGRSRVAASLIVTAAAVGSGVLALTLGASQTLSLVVAIVGATASALTTFRLVARHVSKLLAQAGVALSAADVRSEDVDVDLANARAVENQLQQELSDLASGRRIVRLAAERGDDYRDHLGLVSRIYDDFQRMSELLSSYRHAQISGEKEGTFDSTKDELPSVDRIVLYIDDLDRCPPRRIVDVLEALHLILAVPLFVVVVAVDPRWLLQSLRLHYADMLGASSMPEDLDDLWHPTPLNYLEKIIQVPFALRPMSQDGVRSLVNGLLSVREVSGSAVTPVTSDSDRAEAEPPINGERVPRSGPRIGPEQTVEQAELAGRTTDSGRGWQDVEGDILMGAAPREPDLDARALVLTVREREFAAVVGRALRTPRSVKKYTNLYRLIRVGVADSAAHLRHFLSETTNDAPEYRAVLILLAVIIQFPEEASGFLLGLGHLSGSDRNTMPWRDYVHQSQQPHFSGGLRYLLTDLVVARDEWTCEPFRRWALEVSRYSFATGQEVFSQRVTPQEYVSR
jgi:hypothetical protein